jgi:hypothetical protein
MLDDRDADAVEDDYFTDPAYFRRIRAVETELIRRYLRGQLASAERERFESRYRTVPELTKRLEEVRASVVPGHHFQIFQVRFALPIAALVLVALGVWYFEHRPKAAQPDLQAGSSRATVAAFTAIQLIPGSTMGSVRVPQRFAQPRTESVRLILELPGRHDPVECRVVLSLIDSSDRRVNVWNSDTILSRTQGDSQQVDAEIKSEMLRPGDYVAEVTRAEATPKTTLATFVFRVTEDSATRRN